MGQQVSMQVTIAQAAFLVHHNERTVRWHLGRDLAATPGADGHMRVEVEALGAVRAWRVDPERLAELRAQERRTPDSQAQLLEQLGQHVGDLERQLRDVQRQVRELRASQFMRQGSQQGDQGDQGGPPSTHGHDLAALPLQDDLRYPEPSNLPLSASGDVLPNFDPATGYQAAYPAAYRGPRTVALADRGLGAPLAFKTKADAARWLSRHGVNELTPKSWRGWPPLELTPTAVLTFALDFWREARARGDHRVTWRLHRCADPECVCRELLAEA